MSTETNESTDTTPSAGSETLSADEKAYFDSRGEKELAPSDPPTIRQQATDTPADPKPEAQQGDDDAVDGEIALDDKGNVRDQKTGRFVPHGAFHKERTRRQALEAELTAERVKQARLDERLSLINEALGTPAAQQAAKAEEVPDPETDIFGYAKYLGKKLADVEAKHRAELEQTTKRIEDSDTGTAYRNDAIAYAKEKPDFGSAYMHLVKALDNELAYRGMADPNARMAEIARLEREEVAFAKKLGKRPAEHIYSLAGMRGYSATVQPVAARSAQSPGAQPGSEQAAPNAEAAAKMTALERGQAAARSLSSTGGGAPSALTAEAMLSMSEAEFGALLAKTATNPNVALRKLLGS